MRDLTPLVLALCLTGVAATARAQLPFLTDDAEVTPRGHFNFEYSNYYAVLPRSAAPDHWQDTNNFVIQFGLLQNLELNVDFPIILINRYTAGELPDAFGFGDIDFAAKYRFFEEDPRGWRPAFTMSAAVEVPSGDPATQLGSGYTDFVVNTIGQKTIRDGTVVHVNVGYQSNGNTLTGAIGIRTPGKIVSEGLSITTDVTPTLNLGADINGAQIRTAHGHERQLQLTLGGTQALGPNTSFAFSMFTGWYRSPQWGILAGLVWTP